MSGCQSAESLFGSSTMMSMSEDSGAVRRARSRRRRPGPDRSANFPACRDPGRTQRNVDQAGAIAHQILDRFVGDEALLQQLRAAVKNLAEDDRVRIAPRCRASGAAVR